MHYCTNCGQESKTKVCHQCGVKNKKVNNYCYWCGEKLNAYASMCPKCKETIKKGFFSTIFAAIPAILWICLNVFMFAGYTFVDYKLLVGLLFVPSALIALPFVGNFIKKITHAKAKRKIFRLGLNVLRIVLALLLFVVANVMAVRTDNPQPSSTSELSSYTYDEYVMYSTITKGFEKVLDSLKNPKSADLVGISYDPYSEVVYFCVIAENSFGGNIKGYFSYSRKNDSIHESDDLKYLYDSAEIKRTIDDLYAFKKAVETADESDVPTQGKNEALESYSKSEREMYDLVISGISSLELCYDDLCIFGYKYSTANKNVYFHFSGKDTDGYVVMYASYTDSLGLMPSMAYKDLYESADVNVHPVEIEHYKDAIKKDISK